LAQNKSIVGSVKDTQNESVIGATVKLMNSSDSSFVKGGITDINGNFLLQNLSSGSYFLEITSMGFLKYRSVKRTLDQQQTKVELPVIILLPAKSTTLNEVVVSAKKPLIEQEIDKTVVNVGTMISAASSNTLEVLGKTPGISVDAQGNISLYGKSGAMVLIDGRSTYMSGTDLVAYLKSLPGGLLDKLELMDNPPAKYDAAGSSIINIILKKNKTRGLTGNLSSGMSMGQKLRVNNSVNVNLNRQKINWFWGIDQSLDKDYTEETSQRTIFDNNKISIANIQSKNYSDYKSNSLSGRFGADFTLSEKTILGVQFFLQNRPRSDEANYVNTTANQEFKGNNNGKIDWNSKSANVNFNHKFNGKGHELSGDLNILNYRSGGLRNFNRVTENELFDNKLSNNINIYNFKTDYSLPLSKGASLESGLKVSFVKNDNDALFRNESAAIIYSRSNHFIYHENINAGYVNFRKSINKKFSLQMGLRAENTNILGELLPNESIQYQRFNQNFTNFFPSVFLSYNLDSLKNHNLSFNFTRRINRPNYQQFNPFLNYVDAYNYTQGNPALQPFYLNLVRFKYQYKSIYTLGFGYDGADGILGEITVREGETFIRKPFNTGIGNRMFMSHNLTLQPTKWLSSTLYFQLARFDIKSNINEETNHTVFFTARVSINQQISFGNGWSSELSAQYKTEERIYPTTVLARASVYFSMQKKILKDKGAIKLNINDIFHSDTYRERIENFQNIYQNRININDTQRIGLAFSYRFGNEKYARKRRNRDNSATEETERVQ
jgi:hypothetical protein